MISKSAEYAIRAMYCLSALQRDGPVTAGELAGRVGVPENYLSKILHQLQKRGVVQSRRGPGGGFALARDPSTIPLADVVEPFDPDLLHRTCLLGRSECSDDSPCAAHEPWMEAAGSVRRFFRETSVAELGPGEAGDACAGDGIPGASDRDRDRGRAAGAGAGAATDE